MRALPLVLGTGQPRTGGGPRPCSLQPAAPCFLSRRFCSQAALTPEEREQRALYAAILEYEQDHVSLRGQVQQQGCGGVGGQDHGSLLWLPFRPAVGGAGWGGSCRPAGVGSSLPPRLGVNSRPGLLGCSLGRGRPTVGVLPSSSPRSPALQDWPKHWRAKLKRSPGDLSLVTSLVSHLLRYQGLRPPPLVVAERIIMRRSGGWWCPACGPGPAHFAQGSHWLGSACREAGSDLTATFAGGNSIGSLPWPGGCGQGPAFSAPRPAAALGLQPLGCQ